MIIILWIVQIMLAIIFFAHGLAFIKPPAKMQQMIESGPLSKRFRIFIGSAEIIASIGLILPGLMNYQLWLTPLAALGLIIIMTCAVSFHLTRRERKESIVTFLILILLLYLFYMRRSDILF